MDIDEIHNKCLISKHIYLLNTFTQMPQILNKTRV